MNNNFATIYKQDLEFISKCILDFPDIETGGDFFGFWNNLGMPVILYVTGPAENCYRHATFFKQDMEFLVGVGNFVYANFGLQHIGCWHSHHKLSLAVPSSHDCKTMVNAINKNEIEKFFMILGNITPKGGTTVNGFLFDKVNQTNYFHTQWKVLETENVISNTINSNLQSVLQYTPKTKKPLLQDLNLVKTNQNLVLTIDFEPQSWLGSKEGKQELKQIYNWFTSNFNNAKMYITESNALELKTENISLIFSHDFPNSFPIIEIQGNLITSEQGKFEYESVNDFIQYIDSKINLFQEQLKINTK